MFGKLSRRNRPYKKADKQQKSDKGLLYAALSTLQHTTIVLLFIVLLSACSATKYVPEGSYLLDKVDVKVEGNADNVGNLTQYLRQRPNFKAFGFFRIYLGVYNLSGRDTSKKINRKLKEIGEKPIIYDPYLTFQSEKELQKYMRSMGYIEAEVSSNTLQEKEKKISVTYVITPHEPYKLRNITNNFDIDPTIDSLLKLRNGYAQTLLKKGDRFDLNVLDDERTRISNFLRNRGYFNFNKEYLSFSADTSIGNHLVDINMILSPYTEVQPDGVEIERSHQQYSIRNISITTYNGSKTNATNVGPLDTLQYSENFIVYSNGKPLIKPRFLEEDLRITPGSLYRDFLVQRTYSRFKRLGILRQSNIQFEDLRNGMNEIDCNISLFSTKPQSFSIDIEGTNSNGDLGFAGNVGYMHRNIFRGSETLGINAKYAQEAYSGLADILHKFVLDIGGEVSLTFPRFIFPLVSKSFKRKIEASTEFKINYNYQVRPNTYERTTVSLGMKYLLNFRRYYKYTIDLIDLNFVNISTSANFDSTYRADKYSVLRESYSDHFVMSTGFSYTYDNQQSANRNKIYYKTSFETAGNFLYAISNIFNIKKNSDGMFVVSNIPYAQFIKGEFDFAYNQTLDKRNHLIYHFNFGIAFPYGNGSVVPFEKRFFGGGANGVRGWSVRTLGPGNYSSENLNDFVKQSGDIKLLMNLEYRTKLFWKLEAAVFLDAGNIWTIKNYVSQPNGQFRFIKFYKQIALAYGVGLRFDFNYFLIRFDLGMKAYNPTLPKADRWRYHDVTWKDDFAFHFAIGYPF